MVVPAIAAAGVKTGVTLSRALKIARQVGQVARAASKLNKSFKRIASTPQRVADAKFDVAQTVIDTLEGGTTVADIAGPAYSAYKWVRDNWNGPMDVQKKVLEGKPLTAAEQQIWRRKLERASWLVSNFTDSRPATRKERENWARDISILRRQGRVTFRPPPAHVLNPEVQARLRQRHELRMRQKMERDHERARAGGVPTGARSALALGIIQKPRVPPRAMKGQHRTHTSLDAQAAKRKGKRRREEEEEEFKVKKPKLEQLQGDVEKISSRGVKRQLERLWTAPISDYRQLQQFARRRQDTATRSMFSRTQYLLERYKQVVPVRNHSAPEWWTRSTKMRAYASGLGQLRRATNVPRITSRNVATLAAAVAAVRRRRHHIRFGINGRFGYRMRSLFPHL